MRAGSRPGSPPQGHPGKRPRLLAERLRVRNLVFEVPGLPRVDSEDPHIFPVSVAPPDGQGVAIVGRHTAALHSELNTR
jgi:hypothetical protein